MAENIRNFFSSNGSSPPTSPSQSPQTTPSNSPQTTPSHSPQTTRKNFTNIEPRDDYLKSHPKKAAPPASPTPLDNVDDPYGQKNRTRKQEYMKRHQQAKKQSALPSPGSQRPLPSTSNSPPHSPQTTQRNFTESDPIYESTDNYRRQSPMHSDNVEDAYGQNNRTRKRDYMKQLQQAQNRSAPPSPGSQRSTSNPSTSPPHSPQTTQRNFTESDHIYESIDDYRRQSPTPLDNVEDPYGKYIAKKPSELKPKPQVYSGHGKSVMATPPPPVSVQTTEDIYEAPRRLPIPDVEDNYLIFRPRVSPDSPDSPPALRPRPQEYFDYENRRFHANTQSRPPSSGNRRSMSFSMSGRPLPPPALSTPQINTGLDLPPSFPPPPPPTLPPPPSPSPNKSTLDTVLGCPQAMKQWYQRQKTWVKILLVFVAVSILAGFGRLIYCAVTDC